MAFSSFSLATAPLRFNMISSAYILKKYLWVPEGGHGPPYPVLPKLVFPCGKSIFSPFENPVLLVGIFHTIQCVKVPIGASGSSIINARLFAFAGTLEIDNGGEMLLPSQVNSDGIVPLFSKAELVRILLLL